MRAPAEIIRSYFAAYESKDRAALEALLTEDFTFTSPLDDCISRERYMERCWPNSAHIDAVRIEKLFAEGDEVFVQYELQMRGKAPFRNTEFFTLRDGRVVHVDVYFGAEPAAAAAEQAVRAVIEDWAEATRQKDVARVTKHFAPDSVRFDLAPPLQTDQPLDENLEDWFATFRGAIGYEIRDQVITTAGDLACAHGFHRITATKIEGTQVDVWFRETLCLRQLDGHWRITHAHESVPFYMDGSVKAALDLKPA